MTTREVRWERMFPDQLEAAFKKCPVLYLPYGMCEPHGLHAAIGLDGLKAHAVCVRAAQKFGGIVAPPDYWHIHELGGYAIWAAKHVGEPARTWLSAMPPWQHFRNVLYHIRQADALGFKAAILFTGHYGPNWQDLKTLVKLVQPYVGTRLYGLPDFEANQPGFDGKGQSGDHAGRVETSLLWALEPECVDMDRMPKDKSLPLAMGRDAAESDRKIGERMVQDEVKFLGAEAERLIAEYDHIKPKHTLLTFTDVERVWDEVVTAAFPEFLTVQPHWEDKDIPPASSIWRRNWEVPKFG